MKGLSIAFALLSPWILYWTLTRESSTLAGIFFIGFLVLRAIPAFVAAKPEQRRGVLLLPALGLGFAALGMALKSGLLFRLVPAFTNFAFALTFFRSLQTTPLIEHYARMVKPNLPEAEVHYCRSLTKIWGIYMCLIGLGSATLAAFGSVRLWATYAGGISYGLVGLLFAVEYVVRKAKFRDFGPNHLDALLRRVFSPPSS